MVVVALKVAAAGLHHLGRGHDPFKDACRSSSRDRSAYDNRPGFPRILVPQPGKRKTVEVELTVKLVVAPLGFARPGLAHEPIRDILGRGGGRGGEVGRESLSCDQVTESDGTWICGVFSRFPLSIQFPLSIRSGAPIHGSRSCFPLNFPYDLLSIRRDSPKRQG